MRWLPTGPRLFRLEELERIPQLFHYDFVESKLSVEIQNADVYM